MLLPDKTIIAVDFDGTLAVTDYPAIIEPIQGVIDFIKYCNQVGDIVILWTCRSNQHLIDAIEWCKLQGIKRFDYVNAECSRISRTMAMTAAK